MEKQFVIIVLDTNDLGYYVFSKWLCGKAPKFNQSHCLYDYKIYKNLGSAEKMANSLRGYFAKKPSFIIKVVNLQEWKDNCTSEKMKKFLTEK